MEINAVSWLGIVLLVAQSGVFSGLNLALFGVSALRLQTLSSMGNEQASTLLVMRKDSNFLLATILWGNVGTNVLLTMVSGSVMTGATAFVFSTFVITFGGEIIPQAYFSRHALRMASIMSPLLRLYQIMLYPIAKPSALILDWWLGKESVDYVSEEELQEALRQHVRAPESDVGRIEGTGAINFMTLDDLLVSEEGEPVDPESVMRLPHDGGRPVFPAFGATPEDPFLQRVQASGKRWVLIAPENGAPSFVLDASGFLRAALFDASQVNPKAYCHRPVMVENRRTSLAEVLSRLESETSDDVIDRDIILLWGEQKRIITGSDILGYLMRGIARRT